MSLLFPVYEFRPLPSDFREPFYRWVGGDLQFIQDDGEYGMAFWGTAMRGHPLVLGVDLPYHRDILWSWCKDGNWGASVRGHPNNNAWHYMLRKGAKDWGGSWNRDKHPNRIAYEAAMNRCLSVHRCANGHGIRFDPRDEHLKSGLLRAKETKKVVKPPKNLVCMYPCEK